MTVETSNITSGPYTGNGLLDEYDYDFRITNKSQLIVYETDDDGVQTVLTVDTDYTVAGVGVDEGGTITRVAGNLPAGYKWYIRSNYSAQQETAFASQGGFYPRTHEAAFDKLTMLMQQVEDQIQRSLRLASGYSGSASPVLSAPVAGAYLRWSNDGSNLINDDAISVVATITGAISTVAGIADEVEDVAAVAANVTTVAGIDGEVVTVAGIAANVTAVAGIDTEVATVAGIAAEVAAVAAISIEVQGVYAIRADIELCADNMTEIQGASANAATATTQAGIATTKAAEAAASAVTATTGASTSTTQAGIATTKASEAAASAALAAAIALGVSSGRPTIRPTLLLDFANTKQLDPRVTFTRAGAGAYYDGVTTVKAEENLRTHSGAIGASPWALYNVTASMNAVADPAGAMTGTTITLTDTAGAAYVPGAAGFYVTGETYTMSAYFKKGTNNFCFLNASTSGDRYITAVFNLDAGVVGQTAAAGPNASVISSDIVLENGWYRCSVVFTAHESWTSQFVTGFAPAATGNTFDTYGTPQGCTSGNTLQVCWAQLERRAFVTAYTPTTTQPITNYIPKLLSAAANVPRLTHNPATGESLGVMWEGAATNLLTYSEDFSNAAWSGSSATGTAISGQAIAPDGTLTANKLIIPNGLAQADRRNGPSLSVGVTYSLSVYAKAGEFDTLWIGGFAFGGGAPSILFDLTSGVVTSNTGGLTVTSKNVGNGWWRVSVSGGSYAGGPAFNWVGAVGTGNGYSGIYIWGAQLETGSKATSYIKTEASQVTRAADAPTMTGTNFSDWYNPAEGTFYVEASAYDTPYAFSVSDGTDNNRIASVFGSAFHFLVVTGGAIQANFDLGTVTDGAYTKIAGSYKADDFAASMDGGAASTDTSGSVPVVDRMTIGAGSNGTVYGSITIKKLVYWPKALPGNIEVITE
jgi:hypothetical protein